MNVQSKILISHHDKTKVRQAPKRKTRNGFVPIRRQNKQNVARATDFRTLAEHTTQARHHFFCLFAIKTFAAVLLRRFVRHSNNTHTKRNGNASVTRATNRQMWPETVV